MPHWERKRRKKLLRAIRHANMRRAQFEFRRELLKVEQKYSAEAINQLIWERFPIDDPNRPSIMFY